MISLCHRCGRRNLKGKCFFLLGTLAFPVSSIIFADTDQAAESFMHGVVYELQSGTRSPSCLKWDSGRPVGMWGNSGDYGPESERVFDNGDALEVSATHETTGEKVSYHFFRSLDSCQKALRSGALAHVKSSINTPPLRTDYIGSLEEKYGSKIYYSSSVARQIVDGLNIDCRSGDGRYLPLRNVLLARLGEMSEAGLLVESRVLSRDNEVRIYDVIRWKDGVGLESKLIIEINQWGELITFGFRMEAILNACYGSYGHIWKG